MTFQPRIRLLALVVLVGLCVPMAALSQNLSLTINPDWLYQDECYTITVPGGANMTLDILYLFNGSGPHPIDGWPVLDGNGQAYVCTDTGSPPGVYRYYAIKQAGTSTWSYPAEDVRVYQRPTSLSFSSGYGYAGNDSYTLSVGNGADITLDLLYSYPYGQNIFRATFDSSGNWGYTLAQDNVPGTYSFTAMRTVFGSGTGEWIPLNPPVTYEVRPPRPTWSSVDRNWVQAGVHTYTLRIGNAANVNLDSVYWFNGNEVTVYGYPDMVEEYPGSPDGKRVYPVSACHPPGDHVWLRVRNPGDADSNWWQDTPIGGGGLWVTVEPPPPPTVSSVSPGFGARLAGTNNLGVTINGSNLCNVSLQTSWQGLTFASVPNGDGSSVSTTFHVAPTAWVGTAPATLNATGGSTGFNFIVTNGLTPTVSAVSPATGLQGTNVQVTLTGTNLTGGSLSTNPAWSGLTFTNVQSTPQGTSLTATFNVGSNAAVGTPTIRITTNAGNTQTQLFTIGAAATPPTLTREYIYLGDRVIAVDSP
jgi:hypothetical protein